MFWIIVPAAVITAVVLALAIVIQWNRKTPWGQTDFLVSAILLYYNLVTPEDRELTIPEQRTKLAADTALAAGSKLKMALITEPRIRLNTHAIPLRVYTPVEYDGASLLLYLHGGGFAIGSMEVYDNTARLLAARTGAIVISVDYRLAPEHPFPAGVEDAYTALMWTCLHARELGGDPGRIMVAGDSAGANLATVICRLSRDKQGPPVTHQLLFYPWTDLEHLESRSYQNLKSGYVLTGKELEQYRELYLTAPDLRSHPCVSPARAVNLSGLPPALIVTAGFDPLRDDGEAYAQNLGYAGNTVRYYCQPGVVHGFLCMRGFVPKQVEEAMEFVVTAIAETRELAPRLPAGRLFLWNVDDFARSFDRENILAGRAAKTAALGDF